MGTISKNIVSDNIINAKGDIFIGDQYSINIYSLSDYHKIRERIEEIEEFMEAIGKEGKKSALFEKYRKKLMIERKKEDDFKVQIIQLAASFSNITLNSRRLKEAQKHFTSGNFKKVNQLLNGADLIKDQKKLLKDREKLEQQLMTNANELLIKAQSIAADFGNEDRIKESQAFFKRSIESHSFFDNNFLFARFLHNNQKLKKAAKYYTAALHSKNVLPIYKAKIYQALGQLSQDVDQFEEAKAYYLQARDELSKLIESKTDKNRLELISCLNDTGTLYEAYQDLKQALVYYQQAFDELAIFEGGGLGPREQNKFLSLKACTFNNIGTLHYYNGELEDALDFFNKALPVYENLLANDPGNYNHLPDLATLHTNLGALYYKQKETQNSLNNYLKALDNYQELDKKIPYSYTGGLGTVHVNLGLFFLNLDPNKEKSIEHTQKGMALIDPLRKKIPYTQQYYDTGLRILEQWEGV